MGVKLGFYEVMFYVSFMLKVMYVVKRFLRSEVFCLNYVKSYVCGSWWKLC